MLRSLVGSEMCIRDSVRVTQGADTALQHVFGAFRRRLALPTPCYPPLAHWPNRFGWEVEHIAIEDASPAGLSPQVNTVLLNMPHNPTGWVPSPSELDEWLCWLDQRPDRLLISDEVFAGLPSDPDIPCLATMHSKVLSVGSLSKCFGLPGLRVGWVVAQDPKLIAQVEAGAAFADSFISPPLDRIAVSAVRNSEAVLATQDQVVASGKAAVRAFLRRHSECFDGDLPMAGPNCWVRWKGKGTAVALSEELKANHGLLLAHGGFFSGCESHVRIGLGSGRVEEDLERMSNALHRLGYEDTCLWTI
eukprot:TRINITY_DN30532_c0_g1_i1.p1 TRINITY_DN30532_c0_g1~~TRINITY_DN30532_c0_g1_i1.p1  ORF type:complete len:305 (-),score=57.25 TRINITY_DN30532_c0_g1_i1:294-1208(-)